jgi:hypothetical protein
MAYQFVSEDPSPAQKPFFESASQVTDYKTQEIYDSNAQKNCFWAGRYTLKTSICPKAK